MNLRVFFPIKSHCPSPNFLSEPIFRPVEAKDCRVQIPKVRTLQCQGECTWKQLFHYFCRRKITHLWIKYLMLKGGYRNVTRKYVDHVSLFFFLSNKMGYILMKSQQHMKFKPGQLFTNNITVHASYHLYLSFLLSCIPSLPFPLPVG